MNTTPFRTHAPFYAHELGWQIFPLTPETKIPVPGCDRCRIGPPDKPNPKYIKHTWRDCPCLQTPGAVCHGLAAATNDPEAIEQWRRRYPNANIAVHLGRTSALIIDLDRHRDGTPEQPLPGIDVPAGLVTQVDDGIGTFGLLCTLRGHDWPDTLAWRTGGGGVQMMHVVEDGFRFKSSAGQLGWQIDIKAGNAYGVLPGSVTEAGAYEVVHRRAPVALPEWLASELERTGHVREQQPQREPSSRPARMTGGRGYVATAVESELDRVATCPAGQRNEQLARSAYALGQFVGAGLLDRDAVHDAITQAAQAAQISPHEPKAQDTIRRGIDAGARNPRTIPERQR